MFDQEINYHSVYYCPTASSSAQPVTVIGQLG